MTAPDLVTVPREVDQPSIATKQATDETAAFVLSDLTAALRHCSSILAGYARVGQISERDRFRIVEEQRSISVAEALDAADAALGSDAQLTKTPSADHDGCICQNQHRRGYCTEPGCPYSPYSPNHQPHAVSQGFDFRAHLQRQIDWSGKTFGPGDRAKGVVDHIRKELGEIECNPTDLTEWIDVAILAFDGAWRTGASPDQIIAALVTKQTKNEGRVWPDWRTSDPNKAIEHNRYADVRESPLPAPPSPAKTGGQQ